MKNTSTFGNEAERIVAKHYQERGYVVASRRHIGGAGDLLCVHPGGEVLLVEVKRRRKNLWGGFTKADRQAMREVQLPLVSGRYLANVEGTGKEPSIRIIHERDWP